MKSKSVYLIVRLDVEYQNKLKWEDVKQEIISEVDYNFDYQTLSKWRNPIIQIINTEICGENEIYEG